MNKITEKVIQELSEELSEYITVVNDELFTIKNRDCIISEDGDVNYHDWHNRSLSNRFFMEDIYTGKYLITEEDADEFKQVVLDYYRYYLNQLKVELSQLLPDYVTLCEDELVTWNDKYIIIDHDGNVNHSNWHDGELSHECFKLDGKSKVYIDTPEQVENFKKVVLDFYCYDDVILSEIVPKDKLINLVNKINDIRILDSCVVYGKYDAEMYDFKSNWICYHLNDDCSSPHPLLNRDKLKSAIDNSVYRISQDNFCELLREHLFMEAANKLKDILSSVQEHYPDAYLITSGEISTITCGPIPEESIVSFSGDDVPKYWFNEKFIDIWENKDKLIVRNKDVPLVSNGNFTFENGYMVKTHFRNLEYYYIEGNFYIYITQKCRFERRGVEFDEISEIYNHLGNLVYISDKNRRNK